MRRLLLCLLAVLMLCGVASAVVNDYNASLSLLLHNNQSPTNPTWMNDSSVVNNKIVSVYGANTTTITTVKRLGNASGYFDGIASYATAPDSVDWIFGTKNITISFWLNATTLPSAGTNKFLLNQRVDGNNAQQFTINNTGGIYYLDYMVVSGGTTTLYRAAPIVISTNTWNQFVFVRRANDFLFYENGTQIGTTTTSTASVPDLAATLNIARWSGGGLYYGGYIDELAIWSNATSGTPQISDLYPQTEEIGTIPVTPPGQPIVAAFTASSNPSTAGAAVSFTDTSTGTPTTWNWTIDGSITNTTQNAAYTFATFGTYPINLNVTNATGHFSDVTINQVVTNVTSFTQQDIYLTGQYTITFNVKSSTTNLPIANVTVVDSVSGQSYPSTNGTAFLTLPAGLYYINFIADGYQSKQVTYVVDQDEVHEATLDPVSPSPTSNTNTIYVPRLVRLRAVDNWRTPLTPVTITASYISDTLPNNDRNYLMGAFGISSSAVDLMLNSSVAMSGVTGSDGSNTFSMFPALTYNITVSNETMGVHCQQNLAPADTDYVLFCPTDAQKAVVVPLSQTLNRSYIWVTEPNASYVTINSSYQDLTGLTTSVLFNVTVVDNNTVIYSKNFGNPGTALVLDNYTMPNIRGMQIKSYLAYNRSAS